MYTSMISIFSFLSSSFFLCFFSLFYIFWWVKCIPLLSIFISHLSRQLRKWEDIVINTEANKWKCILVVFNNRYNISHLWNIVSMMAADRHNIILAHKPEIKEYREMNYFISGVHGFVSLIRFLSEFYNLYCIIHYFAMRTIAWT